MKTDSKDRKERPIFTGVLMYFPDALEEVADLLVGDLDLDGVGWSHVIYSLIAQDPARAALQALHCLQCEVGPFREIKEPSVFGLLQAYGEAFSEIAHCSFIGNLKHSPGAPLRWVRDRSADHEDCAIRHLVEAGKIDDDKIRHSVKVAWRCLANLQVKTEESLNDLDRDQKANDWKPNGY